MPNCEECPAFLSQEDTRVEYKRDLGAPVCQQFGYVLGKPSLTESQNKTIRQTFASKCDRFGQPLTTKATALAPVVTPDKAVFLKTDGTDSMTNCRQCKNFVPDAVVSRDLGWYLPLCAATGQLLTNSMTSRLPKTCVKRERGINRSTTEPWAELMGIYDEAFKAATNVFIGGPATVDLDGNFIEPSEYPTDVDVEPEDAAIGVRAWRKVGTSPTTGEDLYLPIFNPESFDDQWRSLIPKTGDDEHPEAYVDHMGLTYKVATASAGMDRTVALWGEPGTGKTEFARHLAWLMQVPFVRINVTKETEVDDLAGKFLFEGNETVWVDGRMPLAWEERCVLLVDEPNAGSDAVWQFFRPLTDNSKQMVLDQAKGDKRSRNDHCYFLMAMNPTWDIRNTGLNEISEADGNRLTHVLLHLPDEKTERSIIRRACEHDGWDIPEDLLTKIIVIAQKLRGNEALPVTWGIRPQLGVAAASRWLPLEDAYRLAVTDQLEPASQDLILNTVRDF